MPTPQPPLLLVDNWFDTIQQYPTASIVASSEAVGREARRVADYRRDRTYWMPASAGERPHLDMSNNTAGGSTNTRYLTGVAGAFNQSSTSHTFAFLLRSAAAITAGQILLYINGPTSAFICYRSTTGNQLGFWNGSAQAYGAGATAPTDDAWHSLIFIFDGATSLSKVYLDGVQVGTAGGVAWTPQALNKAGGVWSVFTHGTLLNQSTSGRIGRLAYWNTAQTANVAAIHTALIGEDRSAGGIVAGANYEWDAFYNQGTQTWVERRGGAANLVLGDTTAVEANSGANDDNDPIWAGGHWIAADAGSGNLKPTPDALWIDRGHNLWGCTVVVENTTNPASGIWRVATDRAFAAVEVPALNGSGNYVAGGDPTAGWCVTEEGALYTLLSGAKTAGSAWRLRIVAPSASFTPIVPGLILGKRTQLPYYSATYDEDQGERVQRTEQSDTGALASSRVYAYRTLDLDLQVIGDTTYDSQIRALRTQLFEANQPALVALNYGMNPERAWLFQNALSKWGFPKKGAYRSGKLSLREVGAKLR